MNKVLLISCLILLNRSVLLSQTEKINFLNFGVISISNETFLDATTWQLTLEFEDTTYGLEKESIKKNSYIFFNVLKLVKNYDFLDKEASITIKKQEKTIHKSKRRFSFKPETNMVLSSVYDFENNEIRGEIIDAYSVVSKADTFTTIRTNYKDLYSYWYMLKNNKVINTHSEKKGLEFSKIILSDLDKNEEPEFNFFYSNEKKLKMIQLKGEEKIISSMEEGVIKLPLKTVKEKNLIYQGFMFYYLKTFNE